MQTDGFVGIVAALGAVVGAVYTGLMYHDSKSLPRDRKEATASLARAETLLRPAEHALNQRLMDHVVGFTRKVSLASNWLSLTGLVVLVVFVLWPFEDLSLWAMAKAGGATILWLIVSYVIFKAVVAYFLGFCYLGNLSASELRAFMRYFNECHWHWSEPRRSVAMILNEISYTRSLLPTKDQ